MKFLKNKSETIPALKPMRNKFKSFLLINPFGIGDIIFSTPLIRNLKENFPEAKVFYLCNKKTYPILKNHPLIDKVFIYERDEFVDVQRKSLWGWLKKFQEFILDIKKEKIDVCLDLSLNTQYGFFAWLAGIPKRYGLDYKSRSKFLNRKIKIDGFVDKHVADYYLDTLKLLNITVNRCGLEVYTDLVSKEWANEFFKKNSILKEDFVIGIAPCGGDAFGKDNYLKRWPSERFSLLIDRLVDEYKAKIFIFSGPKEKEDVIGIMHPLKHKKAVFEFSDTSLEKTIALVERCQLFISNDTGILRFAEGLNKKIVALYGPIDEKIYGPYSLQEGRVVVLKKDLPCRPCYRQFKLSACLENRKCLLDISVEEVLTAVRKVM
jgi:lipopolysaccharide heptosyltransferase II